jgi:hypothetical protein
MLARPPTHRRPEPLLVHVAEGPKVFRHELGKACARAVVRIEQHLGQSHHLRHTATECVRLACAALFLQGPRCRRPHASAYGRSPLAMCWHRQCPPSGRVR